MTRKSSSLSADSGDFNDCQKLAIVMRDDQLTMEQIKERIKVRFGREQTMTDHTVPDGDYSGAGGKISTCMCRPFGCIVHANGLFIFRKDAVFTAAVRLRGQNVLASVAIST